MENIKSILTWAIIMFLLISIIAFVYFEFAKEDTIRIDLSANDEKINIDSTEYLIKSNLVGNTIIRIFPDIEGYKLICVGDKLNMLYSSQGYFIVTLNTDERGAYCEYKTK